MGDVNHEPTMEEILSSIKRIIAEDGDVAIAERAPKTDVQPEEVPVEEMAEATEPEVLELTDTVEAEAVEAEAETVEDVKTLAPERVAEDAIVSEGATQSSRAALAALSAISNSSEKSEAAGSRELDEMVRDMLRPMLKDWLDQNLPGMVKEMVAKEIARIAGASN